MPAVLRKRLARQGTRPLISTGKGKHGHAKSCPAYGHGLTFSGARSMKNKPVAQHHEQRNGTVQQGRHPGRNGFLPQSLTGIVHEHDEEGQYGIMKNFSRPMGSAVMGERKNGKHDKARSAHAQSVLKYRRKAGKRQLDAQKTSAPGKIQQRKTQTDTERGNRPCPHDPPPFCGKYAVMIHGSRLPAAEFTAEGTPGELSQRRPDADLLMKILLPMCDGYGPFSPWKRPSELPTPELPPDIPNETYQAGALSTAVSG